MPEKNCILGSLPKRIVEMISNIPRNTQKYPRAPEIPESKQDAQKYPIVYFNTPTWPEPNPLPNIFSIIRLHPKLPNPTRWLLLNDWFPQMSCTGHCNIIDLETLPDGGLGEVGRRCVGGAWSITPPVCLWLSANSDHPPVCITIIKDDLVVQMSKCLRNHNQG